MIMPVLVVLFATGFVVLLRLPEDTIWRLRGSFLLFSWLPLGLSAAAFYRPAVQAVQGYLIIVVLVLVCLSSLLLLLLGVRIVVAARRRNGSYSAVLAGTLLAASPLVAIVLYVLIRSLTRSA